VCVRDQPHSTRAVTHKAKWQINTHVRTAAVIDLAFILIYTKTEIESERRQTVNYEIFINVVLFILVYITYSLFLNKVIILLLSK